MSFNMDCRDRTRRTKVLTCPASDAFLFIYRRNPWRFRILRIGQNHLDCSCRTVFGTVATVNGICIHDTKAVVHYCMTNLH